MSPVRYASFRAIRATPEEISFATTPADSRLNSAERTRHPLSAAFGDMPEAEFVVAQNAHRRHQSREQRRLVRYRQSAELAFLVSREVA